MRETITLEGSIFFRPDKKMLKWLADYAKDRIIIDVGAGTCWLLKNLRPFTKVGMIAIEPYSSIDPMTGFYIELLSKYNIQFLPWNVQKSKNLIQTLGSKALVIFARPCHSDFVEIGIDYLPKSTEALYITVPENLEEYNDLGKWKSLAKQIIPEGTSVDNEVIYSIIKS